MGQLCSSGASVKWGRQCSLLCGGGDAVLSGQQRPVCFQPGLSILRGPPACWVELRPDQLLFFQTVPLKGLLASAFLSFASSSFAGWEMEQDLGSPWVLKAKGPAPR